MRVELAALSLALPTIVGASDLAKDRHVRGGLSANDGNGRREREQQVPFSVSQSKPLWKVRDKLLINPALSLLHHPELHYEEPDVGILAHRSIVQGDGTDDDLLSLIDICQIMSSTNITTCDCSNWSGLVGTFTCQVNNGDQYCFDDDNQVCASISLSIQSESESSGTSAEYCINMTKPEQHTYCSYYYMISDGLSESGGDFGSAASNCTLTVDGTKCRSCAVEACDGGTSGPGPFDCSNTNAGSMGNQCNGDVPFPVLALAILDSPEAYLTDDSVPTFAPSGESSPSLSDWKETETPAESSAARIVAFLSIVTGLLAGITLL